MITQRRIWCLFTMTLLAGMMAGAAIMQVYIQTRLKVLMRGEHERYYEYFLRRLSAELKLSPEQYAQAKAVILAHNHPSGDPAPSAEDIRITRQLIQAGKILDLKVLDHVIIGRPSAGNKNFYSLRETGLVDFSA